MHILQTVLHTIFKVPTWRVCLKIKSLFSSWSFPLFLCLQSLIQRWYCKEKFDVNLRAQTVLSGSLLKKTNSFVFQVTGQSCFQVGIKICVPWMETSSGEKSALKGRFHSEVNTTQVQSPTCLFFWSSFPWIMSA